MFFLKHGAPSSIAASICARLSRRAWEPAYFYEEILRPEQRCRSDPPSPEGKRA
jgi:hypothetical protein